MSRTPIEKRAAALGALTEGMSLRAVSRLTGLGLPRLCRLVLEAGKASERLLDEHVRDVPCEQLECDEQWMYVQKRRHRRRPDDPAEVGDAWVWSGIDPSTRLIPAHHVGKRRWDDAEAFARRLRRRVRGRPQFNTDRLHAYRGAILGNFSVWNGSGWDRPDWATVVKRYRTPEVLDQGRYVPPRLAAMERRAETGCPDLSKASTSHIESHHLQFRMRNKRAVRMTNAASKTFRHLRASVGAYMFHYNFVRRHSSIRTTPAVAAGLAERPWALEEWAEWVELYGR